VSYEHAERTDRTGVNANDTEIPARAILSRVRFPSASGSCTGWFYGPDFVATAGHCVYNSDYGGWATSITIYPGRNGTAAPYGSTTAAGLYSVSRWTDGEDSNHDYGAIWTNAALGNTTGWLRPSWDWGGY
jgi:glutamyl endopeptidase